MKGRSPFLPQIRLPANLKKQFKIFFVTSQLNLSRLLDGIGVPEPKPFVPDDWQQEAVDAISHADVIVSAPTGSGKDVHRSSKQLNRLWQPTKQ